MSVTEGNSDIRTLKSESVGLTQEITQKQINKLYNCEFTVPARLGRRKAGIISSGDNWSNQIVRRRCNVITFPQQSHHSAKV
jgi:hypothetical protein